MSEQKKVAENGRVIGIDLLKIMSMLMIFFMHSANNVVCRMTYGIFTLFIAHGNLFMIMFFLISGFSMQYVYGKKDLIQIDKLKNFYIKRMVGLYPVYIAGYILWLFAFNSFSIKENLMIAPTELLLLQSTLPGSFEIMHNGGTWFVSCFLFCYLVYPFVSNVIGQMKRKGKMLLFAIILFICIMIPLVVWRFGFHTIYYNAFYRILEFVLGMLICDYWLEHKARQKFIELRVIAVIAFLGLGGSIYWYSDYKSIPLFNAVVLVLFIVLVYQLASYQPTGIAKIIVDNKVIRYLSSLSYTFLFPQFFVWYVLKYLNEKFTWFETYTNIKCIVVSFMFCLVCAILLHELIEKPFKKLGNRIYQRKVK